MEWATDSSGRQRAKEFFDGLAQKKGDRKKGKSDQAKILALFQRWAESGRIANREKYRSLGEQAGREGRSLYEFKSFQVRMIGRPLGRTFVVAHGVIKKRDDLRPEDIRVALEILAQDEARRREKGR